MRASRRRIKIRWSCPKLSCSNSFVSHVKFTVPPTCASKKHVRVQTMIGEEL